MQVIRAAKLRARVNGLNVYGNRKPSPLKPSVRPVFQDHGVDATGCAVTEDIHSDTMDCMYCGSAAATK